jgi:hypothetical protein
MKIDLRPSGDLSLRAEGSNPQVSFGRVPNRDGDCFVASLLAMTYFVFHFAF